MELSKNPDFNFEDTKEFYETNIKSFSPFSRAIKDNLSSEPLSFFLFAQKAIKEYPDLAEILRETLECSKQIDNKEIILDSKKSKIRYWRDF